MNPNKIQQDPLPYYGVFFCQVVVVPSFFGRETQYLNFFLNGWGLEIPVDEPLQNCWKLPTWKKTQKFQPSNWRNNHSSIGWIKKWKMLIFESTESRLPMVFSKKKTDFSWEVNKSWQRSKNPGPHEWRSKHQKYALICRFFEWSDWRSRYVDFMNISWKKCLDALQGFLSIHLFLASF